MARTRGRKSNPHTQKVLQVREDGDYAAARIDRTISGMRSNASSTMIVAKTVSSISVGTTAQSYTITYTQLTASDDFASMASQYNTFKVKSMRFEVFHVNPSVATPVAVSTVHGEVNGDYPANYVSEQAIIDAPDAQYLEPGSKKQVFYWNARGTLEKAFQDVNTVTNFGGLRFYVAGGTAQTAYQVIASFVVVFRGRH